MKNPSLKIIFVEPKEGIQRKKRAKESIVDIPHDLSFAYPLKAVFEQLFGKKKFLKLKENTNLLDWKYESKQILKAIRVSISQTVKICDNDWIAEVESILSLGEKHISSSNNITDLFAYLASTFIRLSFLQVGFLPHRSTSDISLHPKYWSFDAHRSVQYVQNIEQKNALRTYQNQNKPTP